MPDASAATSARRMSQPRRPCVATRSRRRTSSSRNASVASSAEARPGIAGLIDSHPLPRSPELLSPALARSNTNRRQRLSERLLARRSFGKGVPCSPWSSKAASGRNENACGEPASRTARLELGHPRRPPRRHIRVTTAPAPTSAPAPMRMPPSTTAPEPIDAPSLDDRARSSSRLAVCSAPDARRGTWGLVVHEHHPVADEHLVLDRDAVADERVALDLAARADDGAALDLDERPDPRVVPDRAAVEVRERDGR